MQRKSGGFRDMLWRTPNIPCRLQAEERGRGRGLLGRKRCPAQGETDESPARRPDRLHEGPLMPSARTIRRGSLQPVKGTGRNIRGGAEEAREELRVPHVPQSRTRLLLLHRHRIPARTGNRWLEETLRVLREAPCREELETMCTGIVETTPVAGSG